MRPKTTTIALLLTALLMAGCTDLVGEADPETLAEMGFTATGSADAPLSADELDWPDFSGQTLRILDHGAFPGFGPAAENFTRLTSAEVTHTEADDTGTALNQAIRDRGDPQHDILYGVDNALLARAMEAGVLRPYTPQLADRVSQDVLFFVDDPWPATPVDHGYIGLNVDADHAALDGGNVTIDDLFDVRENAELFVTQDPRTSTPGLGFLVITIGVFGEGTSYDWTEYWRDLFDGGVKITSGWSEAYETHFSGGYGVFTEGHIGAHPIVTSYTESPAYEAYYGATDIADELLEHRGRPAVFHQVQTMGILSGTPSVALAQAWIEFTLTDEFQALAAPLNAVYPVVPTIDTDAVYGDLDPEPGTFDVVDLRWDVLGDNLERWLLAWTDLCEAHACI